MDRSANRPFSLSQPYQPQLQPQTPSNQLTTRNSTENSALSNIANQSQPPRLTQALVSQNTAHGLADVFGNKDEQEDINIKEFSELKISGYSSSQSIQSPTTKPELTEEIFSQICLAQSKSDLENCMRIVGVSSLQELCEMTHDGNTVLMKAALTGNAKLTCLLLKSVADPQKLALMSVYGLTALMYAADSGHVEVITAMLANVPNPQQVAENKSLAWTAMANAMCSKNAEAITALLSGVPNPQQLAEQGYGVSKHNNALTGAVKLGNVDCVAAVLAGVPNPKALVLNSNKYAESALMVAALEGRVGEITKIFEYIDDAEALIFQEDFFGRNAFFFALNSEHTEAALLLFDKAKDKAALLLDKNGPDKKAAIQMMKPEILDLFIKKYNESKE